MELDTGFDRITPTAFSFVRKLHEPLVVVVDNGQEVTLPADAWLTFSSVGLSMDGKLLDDPETFMPERWIEGGDTKKRKARDWPLFDHPLMRDGFGYGPRKCLGARVAQLELWAAVTELVRNYQITLCDEGAVYEVANHASTYPDPAPQLMFSPIGEGC